MLARLKGAPTPIREVRPDLPPRLEAVITRALSLQPADRPGTMDELAFAFEAVTQGGVLSRLFGK
jgi:hypothetical protein